MVDNFKGNVAFSLCLNLFNFIDNLEYGVVYSVGFACYQHNVGYKTLGEHMLVTKLIDKFTLLLYLESLCYSSWIILS